MISALFHKYLEIKYRDVGTFINNPHKIQEETLNRLLRRAENTYIGRQFSFSSVMNKDGFRKKVPVFRYEDLRPYLDKIIIEKQPDILWDKPIEWFAMSSGTTGDKSKYIPVTRESLVKGHYKCGEQMLALYARCNPDSRFFLGKTLVMGGSQQINSIGGGIYTGDISAVLTKNLPFWARLGRTPESITLMPDWEEKLDALTKYSINHDIRAFMGVPSWLLILLRKIREESGKELTDLWPSLEVFFHGGVNFTPFVEQYKKVIPKDNMNYWETYNASEGFFGVQYDSSSKDMLLMLNHNTYYEFIPQGEWNKEKPETLTLDEVRTGTNYAILITTNGGLWRYMIGDTIEFTSVNPYLFRITGRTKSFINAFGEELIVDNAENALQEVCRKTNAVISEYTAAPVYFGDNNTGAHEWLIEFENEPSDMGEFGVLLDEALKKQNSDYEAKRSYNLSLQAPVIHNLPKGTFIGWQDSINKIGGQNKIPRLANNREYIDRLLQYIDKKSGNLN